MSWPPTIQVSCEQHVAYIWRGTEDTCPIGAIAVTREEACALISALTAFVKAIEHQQKVSP